jgi:hypothetical protein
MHAYVQWVRAHPSDWERIDRGADWKRTPRKPQPDGTEAIDDAPGHIMSICVGGNEFQGFDHYAIDAIPQGLRVTVWNDDPEDWDEPYAEVWDILTPRLDPRLGIVNTYQTVIAYGDPIAFRGMPGYSLSTEQGPWSLRLWSDFQPPASGRTRHGVWLPGPNPLTPDSQGRHAGLYLDDDGPRAHHQARRLRGWQEWVAP